MKSFPKLVAGGAAALAMVSAAVPVEARSYRHHDGIDAGDVIAGVAIVGGVAAIAAALSNDRYDYDGYGQGYRYRDRYRGGYNGAVNACAYEAQRYGGGQVRITDVDRRGGDSFRVRGVIDNRYGSYGYGERYGGGYYNSRYDDDRGFTCTARGNGRVTAFRTSRSRW